MQRIEHWKDLEPKQERRGIFIVVLPQRIDRFVVFAEPDVKRGKGVGHDMLPLQGRGHVANTDIMVMASALLRSANLAVFELGMWQSWTGR